MSKPAATTAAEAGAEPSGIRLVETRIAPLRKRLSTHAVYAALDSIEDVRVFMQHHIFAVWDFMSLLKALQRALTSVEVPWRPTGSPSTRRFINSIVLEEESDEVDGRQFSHFELYRRAMLEIGADPAPCDRAVARALTLADVPTALADPAIPESVRAFVSATFEFIATGKPQVIASAFTFGREEPIPDMFRALLATMAAHDSRVATLTLYLDRHIHLDEQDHGPMAAAMLAELCGSDQAKWAEAADAAAHALEARLALWSGVAAEIAARKSPMAYTKPTAKAGARRRS